MLLKRDIEELFGSFVKRKIIVLLQELESLLDEGRTGEELEGSVKVGLDSIHLLIFDLYPYELF
ncbi:hypothetical protein [Pedobacter sp. WC2423]|uniref:hypothetical protein n=1 Tax=Pedobacter sp. WC2423 TaxID=3234142 RepID=UPI0034660A9F